MPLEESSLGGERPIVGWDKSMVQCKRKPEGDAAQVMEGRLAGVEWKVKVMGNLETEH